MMTMELPVHLIYEIRVRLPAKSLVRFRGVARSWNNITQDPYLARKQLSNPAPATTLLCFTMFDSENYTGSRSISVAATDFSFYGIQMWVSNKDHCFNGACNGWICFRERDPHREQDLYQQTPASPLLYNPLLKQIRKLPPLPLNHSSAHYASSHNHYGLGFDPNTNLFKLFAIAGIHCRLQFFKFTRNSWSPMELPTAAAVYGSVASDRSGVFLNGVVHFHLELEDPERQVIVAFDVHKEELRLMAFPEAIPPDRLCFLSKLGGVLAIFEYPDRHFRDSFNLHMRVLNPGGGGGGWNVDHKITRHQVGCRFGVTSCRGVRLYPPATCNYQVIVTSDDEVIAYDIRTRKMRILPMPRIFGATTNKLLHSLDLSLAPLNGLMES